MIMLEKMSKSTTFINQTGIETQSAASSETACHPWEVRIEIPVLRCTPDTRR